MNNSLAGKVALITGAAKRVGATTARILHQAGMDLIIHYHKSEFAAQQLKLELENSRANSVTLLPADLLNIDSIQQIPRTISATNGKLDVLINNASTFYPSSFGKINQSMWDDLIGTNLKVPLFLSQTLAPLLKCSANSNSSIINMADIYGTQPLKNHAVYSIAKAGIIMLTKILAQELAPEIRVNAIAPGAILPPATITNNFNTNKIINATALKSFGKPDNIAKAILYLIKDAHFTTGQVLTIDGGRSFST